MPDHSFYYDCHRVSETCRRTASINLVGYKYSTLLCDYLLHHQTIVWANPQNGSVFCRAGIPDPQNRNLENSPMQKKCQIAENIFYFIDYYLIIINIYCIFVLVLNVKKPVSGTGCQLKVDKNKKLWRI
jgi:hypothetical protein